MPETTSVTTTSLLLTCEHGGNQVPPDFLAWFADHRPLLDSHRGWDPGALLTANHFAQQLDAPLFFNEVTRLLVDLNRSETNRAAFSELLHHVAAPERMRILDLYYRPFRTKVLAHLADEVAQQRFVWHLSFHSFTPVLRDEIRRAEIGLLYDPKRAAERVLCAQWRAELRKTFPEFRIRMNYPYRGTSDGHTTLLRRRFDASQYAGIELEVNQRLYEQPTADVERLIAGLAQTFDAALNSGDPDF